VKPERVVAERVPQQVPAGHHDRHVPGEPGQLSGGSAALRGPGGQVGRRAAAGDQVGDAHEEKRGEQVERAGDDLRSAQNVVNSRCRHCGSMRRTIHRAVRP
jgi:hypothetical protein